MMKASPLAATNDARQRRKTQFMFQQRLAIAREIQLSFLPKADPAIAGFDVAGTSRPHDQVGGDYYDFIRVSETRLGIAIADVAGKGIPAALLMAGFRMSLLAEIRNEFALRAVMRKRWRSFERRIRSGFIPVPRSPVSRCSSQSSTASRDSSVVLMKLN